MQAIFPLLDHLVTVFGSTLKSLATSLGVSKVMGLEISKECSFASFNHLSPEMGDFFVHFFIDRSYPWSIKSSLIQCRETSKRKKYQKWGGVKMKELGILADFTIFLQTKGLTIQDICQYLVTVSLKDFGFYCAVFAELQKNGLVRVTSHFGADSKDIEAWQDLDFEIKTPVNDCLRENRIVWINTLPSYSQEYELLNLLPTDNRLKTLVAFPLRGASHLLGSISILSSKKIELDTEIELLIKGLCHMTALRMEIGSNSKTKLIDSQNGKSPIDNSNLTTLTPRQKKILEMLIAKKTNKEIADQLIYSVSTIKQETIAIYEKLGLRGREDSYLLQEFMDVIKD
jgi:DNA-binding CsgD family transcriptional regulator